MKIAFLGTGDFACPSLTALREAGHDVSVAISQPDRRAGRGLRVRQTAVHALADALGVPHLQTQDVNALPLDTLADVESAVVIAFGQKIGPALLRVPQRGFINLHGSLLPSYRGAAPFQWAVINGDRTSGVTVFQLDEHWDSGSIWGRREIEIGETETAAELHDRLATCGAALLVETLSAVERGELEPVPQNAAQATRARKLTRADRVIDFSQEARSVARRINGLWSWPAATCTLEIPSRPCEQIQLARARVQDASAEPNDRFTPGAFRDDLSVQTGRGAIELLEVKPAGGRLIDFAAFRNGRDLRPPAQLTDAGLK